MGCSWGVEKLKPTASDRFTQVLLVLSVLAAVMMWVTKASKPGYLQEDCASYVAIVNHHARYGAQVFFEGRAPGYYQIASTMLATGAEGDVAAFHGVHVAVFTQGAWHDSDPQHDGPGLMNYNPRDPWFHGEVKIFRRDK